MKLLPAIDLREGACVQLVGGDYQAERVRLPDPLAQARAFREAGLSSLHVVDLDAATGRGENRIVVRALGASGADVQVGGGIRSVELARELIAEGAARVVVGTRAVVEPAFRDQLARELPGQVVIALDVRGRQVLTRGWAEGSGRDLLDLLAEVEDLPLAGVLVTAVHAEGKMEGADLGLLREATARTRHRVLASGGVGSLDDLRAVAATGAAGAVVGMALYTGAIDPRAAAEEFDSW